MPATPPRTSLGVAGPLTGSDPPSREKSLEMTSRTLLGAAATVGSLAVALGTIGTSTASAGAAPPARGGVVAPAAPDAVVHSRAAGVARAAAADAHVFRMVRSTAAVGAHCLPHARARVRITEVKGAEKMVVRASGLPHRIEMDLFLIQTPDAPFGMSWYQGDLETNRLGTAKGTFVGRFNRETFTVAPGVAPAPRVHRGAIADASANPATAPVHQYHLGVWFNSPEDAADAGCLDTVTPFNGDHDAGVQALSTRQFAVRSGPLRSIAP